MSSHFHFHNDRKLSSERSGLPPVWIWNKHPHPLIYVGGIYIFFPKVGSIYPIKTFIPQMMASYIQYFWQFLTILENFDNFAKLDFDDFFKIILPSKSRLWGQNYFEKLIKIQLGKIVKIFKNCQNCQKYWIYDAIIWGMNVFIGYMLPTFGKNM